MVSVPNVELRQPQKCRHQKVSGTNTRLRRPSWAASLAELAVSSIPEAASVRESCQRAQHDGNESSSNDNAIGTSPSPNFRVVLGLGPGRSGTKSLTELLGAQPGCCRAEHEMIVPRQRTDSRKKGSWGADRRLEWEPPRLVRGAPKRTEEETASWRVMRLLEQREAWTGWVRGTPPKPKGARAWREYNRGCEDQEGAASASAKANQVPIVAAVSSAALAYVHEYVALDPSVRIVVVTRPKEEVVASFLAKSVGRNHWQRHHDEGRDKTWDNAFPSMTDEECRPFITDSATKPDKAAALRSYCDLYESTASEFARRYPNNVKLFDMTKVLNESKEQEAMLRWCGFQEPLPDINIHLNKSPQNESRRLRA